MKDFLTKQLEFDETEIEDFNVMETRMTTKGIKFLNVAFKTQEQVKEIHIRKTEIGNDDIIVRNYIPPTFYERYMEISRICKDKRTENSGS